jgi:hypothetical protein
MRAFRARDHSRYSSATGSSDVPERCALTCYGGCGEQAPDVPGGESFWRHSNRGRGLRHSSACPFSYLQALRSFRPRRPRRSRNRSEWRGTRRHPQTSLRAHVARYCRWHRAAVLPFIAWSRRADTSPELVRPWSHGERSTMRTMRKRARKAWRTPSTASARSVANPRASRIRRSAEARRSPAAAAIEAEQPHIARARP